MVFSRSRFSDSFVSVSGIVLDYTHTWMADFVLLVFMVWVGVGFSAFLQLIFVLSVVRFAMPQVFDENKSLRIPVFVSHQGCCVEGEAVKRAVVGSSFRSSFQSEQLYHWEVVALEMPFLF